jgi:hypothetical protein
MNTRIFNMIVKKLNDSFHLPKYQKNRDSFDKNTRIDSLPWTPARLEKFKKAVADELQFSEINIDGSIEEVVSRLNKRYLHRFFSEIWKPTTDKYTYSGWALVDLINNQNPKAVLDFGCGYNQFKGRIHNLVGIDPFNNCADYMVDVLDYKVPNETYDHILVLGSLNFDSIEDIEIRFSRLVDLLMSGGQMYFRANPGVSWPNGPYVDIFPWSFEIAFNLGKKYNLNLDTFKQEPDGRLYFVYRKN